jgi:hypothetical protein
MLGAVLPAHSRIATSAQASLLDPAKRNSEAPLRRLAAEKATGLVDDENAEAVKLT